MRRHLAGLALAALLPGLTACVRISPSAELGALAREATGLDLQAVAGGGAGTLAVQALLAAGSVASEHPLPYRGLGSVEVGVYQAALPAEAGLQERRPGLEGWETMFRQADPSGVRTLFVREGAGGIDAMLALIQEGDEVVAARFGGRIDLFLEDALVKLLPQSGWEGFFRQVETSVSI